MFALAMSFCEREIVTGTYEYSIVGIFPHDYMHWYGYGHCLAVVDA